MVANDEKKPEEAVNKFCEEERTFLRRGLEQLKDCQFKLFTFSIMTTGVILGWAGRYRDSVSSREFTSEGMWLIPLVVLLPSWWIFFNKARTIACIIGYCRIIEKILLGKQKDTKMLGWENALKKFRSASNVTSGNRGYGLWENITVIVYTTTYNYWAITSCTFLVLSLMCLLMGLKETNEFIVGFAIFCFGISVVWNGYILWTLVWGQNSYDSCEDKWQRVFNETEQ